ncbi:MAG TPA: hypothetical protein PKY56_03455 [Candidatus Kapabacteria bacterium]|nr:hypothetical protein [Candidatus Kapabacteria bacterium]HPO61842.1 hypothetical protein [Candidatus Kapabacteria bacterium]
MKRIVLILICFLCSANALISESPDKTTFLNNYFKATFNFEIPQSKHYYIFVDIDCSGSCQPNLFPTLNSIKSDYYENLTIIACFKLKASKKKLEDIKYKNLLADKKSYFYSLDIYPNKNAFITTENGKIVSIDLFTKKLLDITVSKLSVP